MRVGGKDAEHDVGAGELLHAFEVRGLADISYGDYHEKQPISACVSGGLTCSEFTRAFYLDWQ